MAVLAVAVVAVVAVLAFVCVMLWPRASEGFAPVYRRRDWKGTDWKCPPGYTFTGQNWDNGDGEKQCQQTYTRREWSGSAWKCPDGYTDTGDSWDSEDGEKQCRFKGADKKDNLFMTRKQRKARKICNKNGKPGCGNGALKCKKDSSAPGGYAWKCLYTSPDFTRGPDMMGCSTDGDSSGKITWTGKECKQEKCKGGWCSTLRFGLSECCEGPPVNVNGATKPGDWGYRLCPGSGKTKHDGC